MMKKLNWKDIAISLLILLVTFGYFTDEYILQNDVDMIDSYTINGMIFYSKMKILIIAFSLIWYFTSRHWWKSSILVIITIELLKLISIFDVNQKYIDEIEYYSSLPVTIPIVILLFIISKKLNKFNLSEEIRSEVDTEIDSIFFEIHQDKKIEIKKLNNTLLNLKNSQLNKNSQEYFQKLISMRDDFYNV